MEENTTALNDQQEVEAKQELTQAGSQEPDLENLKVDEGEIDLADKSLNEILSLFGQMIDEGEQQKLYKYAEPIKAAFYKVLRKEKIASGNFVEVGKEPQDNPFE